MNDHLTPDQKYWADLKARDAANEIAARKGKFRTYPHTPSEQLRETVANEQQAAEARQQRASKIQLRSSPLQLMTPAALAKSLDDQQLTAKGVRASIFKELLAANAAAIARHELMRPEGMPDDDDDDAEPAYACSAMEIAIFGLFGEKYLAHLTQANPAAAARITGALLDFDTGKEPMTIPELRVRDAIEAMLTPSSRELCAKAVERHAMYSRAAAIMGGNAEPISFNQTLYGLLQAPMPKVFAS